MRQKLKRFFTENFLLKLGAVLAAAVLWLFIVNVDDPMGVKTFGNIPVTTKNESLITNSGMIYQIENGSNTVSVTVRARRSVLSRLRAEYIQATADFNDLTMEKLVPIKIHISGYEGQYESVYTTPTNMQIAIEKNTSVRLPISVSTTGTLAEGYFVESTTVSPSTLVVSGPESQVEKLSSVVLRVDVTQLAATETLTGSLLYYDSNGDALDSSVLTPGVKESKISVKVSVLPAKEIPIEVNVHGRPAEGYELTAIDCEPKTVAVIGKGDALDNISSLVIDSDEMNIEGATSSLETVCDLTEFLPEGISLAAGVSEKVMITVKVGRSGTAMVEYPVGSIVVENMAEGYKINYEQTELKLEFSGSMDVLEGLTADDLKVSIDLAEAKGEGNYEVAVKVEAPAGCELDAQSKIVVNLVKE